MSSGDDDAERVGWGIAYGGFDGALKLSSAAVMAERVMAFSDLLDRAAAFGPVLEGAEIAHVRVAEILQGLADERRSSAGGAIHQHGLVAAERFVVLRRLRVGAEFDHPARDVHRPPNLSGALQFVAVAHVVLARSGESLFVEVLRWQFRYAAPGHGWLAGLQDSQVGRVLSLLHALADRPWTVDELAREAAMSRAALAKRFVALVGPSPIQYLAGWRMHLARHLLRESTFGIGGIAGRVGYESEAAFNRAFRRLVGSPPATWRQGKASPTDAQARSTIIP